MQVELKHSEIRLRKEREVEGAATVLNQTRRDVMELVQRALQDRDGFWRELGEQSNPNKP